MSDNIAMPLKLRRGRCDEFFDANGKAVDAYRVLRLVNDLLQQVTDYRAREEKFLAKDKPSAAESSPQEKA